MSDMAKFISMLESGPESPADFTSYAESLINQYVNPENMHAAQSVAAAYAELRKGRRSICIMEELLRDAESRSCENVYASRSVMIRQEKLAALGQLASGIAHELNNPIGFVAGNFEALRTYSISVWNYIEALENAADEMMKQKIAELKSKYKINYIINDTKDIFVESADGFKRVSEIVNNLLAFARVDGGNFKLTSLNSSVQTTAAIVSSQAKFVAAIELNLGDLPDFEFNPGEMNQVLLNLFLNSVQAIKGQKRDSEGHITVKTWTEEGMAVCSVTDDGPGIPQENMQRVFDPFFTTKPVGEGTGLGLNISYDVVVHRHRGSFDVESEPGKTVFTFRLPLFREV
ncbi:sensor histidine kinase [Seleniivibrio woodruffii]|uniref:sensor histidine kinase n=1 Tax=Seleniivibrio woodruffii TaxID=1078050 RepID=UPI0026EC1ABE|nr:ATP-binding protein [Seleniivibrio woodruffii]